MKNFVEGFSASCAATAGVLRSKRTQLSVTVPLCSGTTRVNLLKEEQVIKVEKGEKSEIVSQ